MGKHFAPNSLQVLATFRTACIQLCERVYFDLLGRLQVRVLPRQEALAEGQDAASIGWRTSVRRIEAFLGSPDRTEDLRSRVVAFGRVLLGVDAVDGYSPRKRGGEL